MEAPKHLDNPQQLVDSEDSTALESTASLGEDSEQHDSEGSKSEDNDGDSAAEVDSGDLPQNPTDDVEESEPSADEGAKDQAKNPSLWARLKAEADERYDWSERWYRFRRWLPAIAFFTGFLIDAINLGIGVKFLDLVMVSSYAGLALALLVIRPRVGSEKYTRWLTFGLQFCLGALFSAMVVLYFKSSGHIYAFIFVLGLFAAQVANEFLHRDDRQIKLVWAIYAVSVVMLLNFLIPHWTKSVSPIWFYVSTALGVGIILGIRKVINEPWSNLKVAWGTVAALVGLFIVGAIPPVPLVLKHQLACVDFKKADYSCGVDEPSFLQTIGLGGATVTREKKAVHVLTSVFAPMEIEVKLQHEWYMDTDDGWKLMDTMNFTMRGGRKDGWRIWSRKRNPKAGSWRVATRLKDGAVLGYEEFEVVEGPDEFPRVVTPL